MRQLVPIDPGPAALPGPGPGLTFAQLRHLAFHRHAGPVFQFLRALPREARRPYFDRFILHQAILGAIDHLGAVEDPPRALAALLGFADQTLEDFDGHCASTGRYVEEYFQACDAWSSRRLGSGDLARARATAEGALARGAERYPALRLRLALTCAESLWLLGELEGAEQLLLHLFERPYLLTDRDAGPRIAALLSSVLLHTGRGEACRTLAFSHLRSGAEHDGHRLEALKRVGRLFGGYWRPLAAPGVAPADRVVYAAWLGHLALSRSPSWRSLGLGRASRAAAAVATRAASKAERWVQRGGRPRSRPRGVVVTRAMGGLGDLLMMTPGLHALRRRDPTAPLVFAIPRALHPVFEADDAFALCDIEGEPIRLAAFSRWHNLTDCPAARVESRTAPKVRRNRIELFAAAMGVSMAELDRSGRRPRFVLRPSEREQAREDLRSFRTRPLLVGVQLASAESYRDYPHTRALVARLAQEHDVVVFHGDRAEGSFGPGIFDAAGRPLRQSAALLSWCDALVGPDSALLHFAAALEVPSLLISGPVSGAVRTSDYPLARHLDAKAVLGCVPCWRNENEPCRASGTRTSACMAHVPVEAVVARLQALLQRGR